MRSKKQNIKLPPFEVKGVNLSAIKGFYRQIAARMPPHPIDQIWYNALIYTANPLQPTASALAIHKGRIVAVGNTTQIRDTFSQAQHQIDAQGKPIYPGFHDAHCHPFKYAQSLAEVNLAGCNTYHEVITRTQTYKQQNPNTLAIIGRGWDQNRWPGKHFPDKSLLDAHFPDIPVLLIRIDLHAAVANQTALNLAQISAQTQVENGLVVLDEKGQPNGLLIDRALHLVLQSLPKSTSPTNALETLLPQAENYFFSVGLTTLHEAVAEQDQIELAAKMHAKKQLNIRLHAYLDARETKAVANLRQTGPQQYGKRLTVPGLKYFADGALGSRGAWLTQPYTDDEQNCGLQFLDHNHFLTECQLNKAANLQTMTHAIGNAANKQVLQTYSQVLKINNKRRWRVEHCQVLHPEDVTLFGQYNLIPSIQATHATSDMYWVHECLGSQRLQMAYAFNTLLAQTGRVAAGSDFPIEGINPLLGFYAAVTRQDANQWPLNGFMPKQRLTRNQALMAMTHWAAYAAFAETNTGSLVPGKTADFVVLDRDIMTCPAPEILLAKVVHTVIDGQIVWSQ